MGYPPVASNDPFVINLYSQEGLAPSHTNYNAMYDGLRKVVRLLQAYGKIKTVGFPYQMGCGLADGNWNIVKTIIEQAFEGSDIEIVIVKLSESEPDPVVERNNKCEVCKHGLYDNPAHFNPHLGTCGLYVWCS